MAYYYVALETRSHAFLLERRLKTEGIACELTYIPRELMTDLCNMGVKFDEYNLARAVSVIRRSGLPGCHIFKEVMNPDSSTYFKV